MVINERNIKIWSTIGSRATFGIAALELAKEIDNLMVLTCDVSTSAGLDRYRKTYPDKYLDLGIAEQNLIGVAAGLSSEGFNVVTTTFAPFQTIRCCEQIKVNIGYMKQKICMVGIASGLALGNLGFTHCCIEDIGILRTIPGMTIISPSDSLETVKALEASVNSNKSIYIRLTGSSNNPIVNGVDYKFEIGKSIQLREGKDITIFSAGAMVYNCLEAAKKLNEKNISCSVINMHTIKPIDKEAIKKACDENKIIVSVEEHNVIGGLGSAIAEYKATLSNPPKQLIIGVDDFYSKGGSYKFLQEKHGLSSDKIVDNILQNLK
ncbi:transketolase [Pelagibacterales bacterium SAG-MED20]|nr:transketolase [Pelagibacterales bacterium SAG-MED20]